MKRILSFLVAVGFLSATAQNEVPDTFSVTIPKNNVIDAPVYPAEQTSITMSETKKQWGYVSPWYLKYRIANLGVFDVMPVIPGVMVHWGNGLLYGMTDTKVLPGMMAVNVGGYGIMQNFGRLSVNGYAEAVKYGHFGGIQTSFGFGGAFTYHVNDRLSITAFGAFYTNPGMMPPAMAGYVNVPTFGGYLDYDISGPWGIRVGARTYHSLSSHRWEAQPIAMPYFRLSKNNVVGVDVGGILYQILSNVSKSQGPFNPTIPPPAH